jgi:acyl-CoA thioesterase-1
MFTRWQLLALGVTIGAAGACSRPAPDTSAATEQVIVEPGQLPEAEKTVIVVLGDSLTAGLNLMTSQAYPSLLQEMFAGEGYREVEIVNAGVSGDTTAGGRRRVDSLLAPNVRGMVVALGGNDALRGISVRETRENLAAIIDTALKAGVNVVLAGMEAPTNLGEDYRTSFREMYFALAREYGRRVIFVPFLLEGVAGDPNLNQADGIHPNEAGAKVIAELLYPRLRDMVDQLPDPAIYQTPR